MSKNNKYYLSFLFIVLIVGLFYSNNPISGDTNSLNQISSLNYFLQDNTPVSKPSKSILNQYNISIEFIPASHSSTGWVNVSFYNDENLNISNLLFHLWGNDEVSNSIIIHEILNETDNNLNYSFENTTKLWVEIDPISFNQRTTVNINFTTILPKNSSRFGYSTDSYTTHAFGNWYPILALREFGGWNTNPYAYGGESFYSDMSYYNVSITAPQSEKLAVAGDLQDLAVNGNNITYHYTAGPVRDFSWISSPSYETTSILHNGVNITSYYYPNSMNRGALAPSVSKRSLDLFSDIFEPYPYTSMNIAELNAWFGGMEYSQLIMINSIYYDPIERTYELFEDVISHEWAHTWDTYLIANNPYKDPWLDESWAMYASQLYFERYGDPGYDLGRLHIIKQNYIDYRLGEQDAPLGNSMTYWETHDGYGAIVYNKGPVVIHMLRFVMGDEAFFDAVEAFYDAFTYKTVTVEDFIEIFSNYHGESLDWFMNQFVYGTTFLDYSLTNASYILNSDDNTYDITISITNDNQGSPANMTIPLRIEFQLKRETYKLLIDESIETFEIKVPSSYGYPKYSNIDPDWILLRENRNIQRNFIDLENPPETTESTEFTTVSINIGLFPILIMIFVSSGIRTYRIKRK